MARREEKLRCTKEPYIEDVGPRKIKSIRFSTFSGQEIQKLAEVQGYHRDEEYEEDYDEFDKEASEPSEDDEHKAPKLTKEEEDFLKSREQLKDRFRKNLKNQSANDFDHLPRSHDTKRTMKNDTFGSFFGPSKPVIATRVLEESRSIRETKHIVENISNKKRVPSSSSVKKDVHCQQPKAVNKIKKKAQTLKEMRDYSFLLSDDADFPTPAKEQPAHRIVSAPSSDDRLVQAPLKSKVPIGNPTVSAFPRHEVKKPASSAQRVHAKTSVVKEGSIGRGRPAPPESKKFTDGRVGNGPIKTSGNIAAINKVHTQSMSMNKPSGKIAVVNKVHTQSMNKPSGKMVAVNKVHTQSMSMNKPPSSILNNPSLKKNFSSVMPHSSVQNKHPEQKRLPQRVDQLMPHSSVKQPMPSLKTQPAKVKSSHAIRDDCFKKRTRERNLSDEEDVDYRSLIRGMFGYNPNKYAGMDEDDSDMEVGFDIIQKEERRSSKIARKEDEEQLRLIEEEEERERRMRRKKNKVRS